MKQRGPIYCSKATRHRFQIKVHAQTGLYVLVRQRGRVRPELSCEAWPSTRKRSIESIARGSTHINKRDESYPRPQTKCFERWSWLTSKTVTPTLDPFQFAYRPNSEYGGCHHPRHFTPHVSHLDNNNSYMIGLISNNDESAYREEVTNLTRGAATTTWPLKHQEAQELIVDFRKKGAHTPSCHINGHGSRACHQLQVPRVHTISRPGLLTLEHQVQSLGKKAHAASLALLRRLKGHACSVYLL
ncbi:unnamed protein product [Pleuronectes platessa]|uniref:Uncharacterized protein n=1 Tax=Pleuronectes platessa TaxID=8262 RepID=A0A9N7YFZ2_PLEPL|nr:unnamed protein product [Pleuronectes platessa]